MIHTRQRLTPHSACIAHNTTVLSEHTASASSNASSLVSLVLPTLDHEKVEKSRITIDQKGKHIHLSIKQPKEFPTGQKSAGGLTFLAIANEELGQRIPFGFLIKLEEKFFAEFDPKDTDFAHLPPYGCASFNGALKRLMAEQSTFDGQNDALQAAKREIGQVHDIMIENIERVVERGEHMNVLVDKTSRLGQNAQDFRVRSRTLKRRMWFKNVKLMMLLCLVSLFLIYIFVGFGCGLPAWGRCLRH
jgi:vesicle-associated membrane protein 7